MSSFYLAIPVFLFILCQVQTQFNDKSVQSDGPELKGLSVPKNRNINTVIESFINALHPVDESPDAVNTIPLNSGYVENQENHQEHYQLSTDEDTLSELTDEDFEEILRNNGIDGFKDEITGEEKKFIGPLILSLLSNQNYSLLFNKKPTRRPSLQAIKLKPKFNLTHLIKYRSTIRPNWVLPNDMDKKEQTTSAPAITERITYPLIKAKTGVPSMRPLYGPYNIQWGRVSTTTQNYDPAYRTEPSKTKDQDTDEDYLDLDNYIEKTTPANMDSQFDLAEMIKKINLLMSLQSTTIVPDLSRLLDQDVGRKYQDKLILNDQDNVENDRPRFMNKLNFNKFINKLGLKGIRPTTSKSNLFGDLDELGSIVNKKDYYVPVKLDLPSELMGPDIPLPKRTGNSSVKIGNNIDLEAMIGKINSMMSTPVADKTTAQTTTERSDTTPTLINLDDINSVRLQKAVTRKSRFTTALTYGPVHQKMPDPIIGPMLSPVEQKVTVPSVKVTLGDDAYIPITLSKFKNPINPLLDYKIIQTTEEPENDLIQTESTIGNGVQEQIEDKLDVQTNEGLHSINGQLKELDDSANVGRRRRFPWPSFNQKRELSSTTMSSLMVEDMDDTEDSLYREMEVEDDQYLPIKYNPMIGQSENALTTKYKPFMESIIPTIKPSVFSWGKRPRPTAKIPVWLQSIFNPKATTKSLKLKDTTKEVIVQNSGTKDRTTQNPLEKDIKEEFEPDQLSYAQFGREGNHVGSHSGQSWNGIGYNNGQGGIVIGSNSGNGKRPQKRPS